MEPPITEWNSEFRGWVFSIVAKLCILEVILLEATVAEREAVKSTFVGGSASLKPRKSRLKARGIETKSKEHKNENAGIET